MLQDNPTLQCYSFPAACSTPAPLSSRQTNLHITSAFIPKVLVRAAVIPLSFTLYLSSSLPASGQNNFCCLGVFSFLCVSNISANRTCLHSEPQWPIGPRCCCPTSCPFHSADAGSLFMGCCTFPLSPTSPSHSATREYLSDLKPVY